MKEHKQKLFEKIQHLDQQCCPTYEDIINARDVSEKLKTKDKIETISNVLEWEDKNIEYWYERADLAASKLFGFIVCAIVLFLCYKIGSSTSFIISTFLIVGAFIYGYLSSIRVYVNRKNAHFISKKNIPGKKAKLKLREILFSPDMSVKDILIYKIAVCRDYAKLSCALLASLNIDSYIVTYSGHAACAVRENGTYYILDQKLPLKKIDVWLADHNKRKSSIYKLKMDSEKKKTSLELIDPYNLVPNCDRVIQKIDPLDIKREIYNLYKIQLNSNSCEQITICIDELDTIYYDAISFNSFMRLIKKRIDNELCGNILNISSVSVSLENRSISLNLKVNR